MPGEETPAEGVTPPQGEPAADADLVSDDSEIVEEPEIIELSADALARQQAEAALEEERQRRSDTEARLRGVSKAYTDLQSEMEEFRKRMEARSRLQVQSKAAEILSAFFEPIQNLKRAAEAGGDAETLQQGLELVSRQFVDTMGRLGLTEVPGVGASFDPQLHEALAVTPVTDEDQDGRILMVHRTGYQLGTHVIQPAQVVIGKLEAPVAEA